LFTGVPESPQSDRSIEAAARNNSVLFIKLLKNT
jgi:hypothetical protein